MESHPHASQSLAGRGFGHDTSTPDIETSTASYAKRFSGPVGEWFLEVQARTVLGMLQDSALPNAPVLELGAGHEQLLEPVRRAGFRLVLHGSELRCQVERERDPRGRFVSRLWNLPFDDETFAAVFAVRLLAHVETWQDLLLEMKRVTKRFVLVDLPVQSAFHKASPALFRLKRKLESNTRPYFQYNLEEFESNLEGIGLRRLAITRQFFFPMVLHRTLKRPKTSMRLENMAARAGLTDRFGSPAILLAART